MFDSILNVFGGILPVGGGFNEGTVEIPEGSEIRDINNSEGVVYGEGDLERIEIAADIMDEIFTDEIVSNWENLTVEEKANYLNEYYARAGEALGINTAGVYVEDLQAMYGPGTMGVNCGDGYVGIDISRMDAPLEELLQTVTHEMRHQLQNDALANPDAFPDISQETLEQWEYEFNNYVDPSYDFEGYEAQLIETDARAFGEEVVNDFISDVKEERYSVEAVEAEASAEAVAGLEQNEAQIGRGTSLEDLQTDDFDATEAKNTIEGFTSEDLDALYDVAHKVNNPDTPVVADDSINTVVKQGSSCGTGKGCMGSKYCVGY